MGIDEWIYDSMMGDLMEPAAGIENAFSEGSRCAVLYEQIYNANQRICQRLGVEEDEDVERIIECFFEMNRELCLRMYRYGMQPK